MLKKILILSFTILSMISGGYYAFNQFFIHRISDIALKATNQKLLKDNLQLKMQIKRLQQKQLRVKKQIAQRRKSIARQKLTRIERKMAKAPAAMMPWVGAAVVVSATVYEVNELCQDIEEDKAFEANLFELSDNINSKEDKVCGLDVKQELMSALEGQLDDSKQWVVESYDDISRASMDELKSYYRRLFN